MKYLSQLLPPFMRKKRNVIKGSDRVKLVPEDAKNIGDADKEYNTVDDIATYTNQNLSVGSGIQNTNGVISLGGNITQNTILNTQDSFFGITSNGALPNQSLLLIVVPGENGVFASHNTDDGITVESSKFAATYQSAGMIYMPNDTGNTAPKNSIEATDEGIIITGLDDLNTSSNLESFNDSGDSLFQVMNNGQILAQKTVNFNFADDTAAAAGGVPIGGLYHNAGVSRIRIV